MRWIGAVVAALAALMLGSLTGGVLASFTRQQAIVDVAGAFLGIGAFVAVGSVIAASQRAPYVFGGVIVLPPLAVLAVALAGLVQDAPPLHTMIAQITGAAAGAWLAPRMRGDTMRGLLGTLGAIVLVLAQLYLLFFGLVAVYQFWGLLGAAAYLIFVPSWPFVFLIIWLVTGLFPMNFFTTWVVATGAGAFLAWLGSRDVRATA